MSKWIEFVKQYSKDNNMSYRDALRDKSCKSEYHSSKSDSTVDLTDSESDKEELVKPVLKKEKSKRPPNAWNIHVKKWAAEHDMTYPCAMSQPECKASYQKIKKPTEHLKKQEKALKELSKIGMKGIKKSDKIIEKAVKLRDTNKSELNKIHDMTMKKLMKRSTKKGVTQEEHDNLQKAIVDLNSDRHRHIKDFRDISNEDLKKLGVSV
jgi:hypothetical protein